MTKTIFRNTFFIDLLVLVICGSLFFGLQYKQTIDETYEALEQETSYAISGLNIIGTDYLDSIDDTNRITWMDGNGDVLYDSEYDASLANQASCSEVRDALSKGVGKAKRRSGSSQAQTVYYAEKLADGSVLRLSRPVSLVWHALVAVSPVLWVLILVLMISGIMAFRVAKQIVTPINNMNLDDHENSPYPELNPLLEKIKEQKLLIQEEAKLREEMRREFSANMTDELKEPITSIAKYAELLSQGNASEEKTAEYTKGIRKESHRLSALIDDIKKLSRLDEEVDLPPKEEVDLYELTKDVAEKMKPVADRNNINIEIVGEPVKIMGIKQILNEMILNLCDNAVKYNYPGGKVTLETVCDDSSIKLSVADTGIGIPAEHQKRVFERFYRVDKTHSQEVGGTGLGLSIVKHGAMYHDADVTMESEPGEGTRITIIFPRKA